MNFGTSTAPWTLSTTTLTAAVNIIYLCIHLRKNNNKTFLIGTRATIRLLFTWEERDVFGWETWRTWWLRNRLIFIAPEPPWQFGTSCAINLWDHHIWWIWIPFRHIRWCVWCKIIRNIGTNGSRRTESGPRCVPFQSSFMEGTNAGSIPLAFPRHVINRLPYIRRYDAFLRYSGLVLAFAAATAAP